MVSRSAAGGFTLLEVIVALLVFEVGFLGVASLLHLAGRDLARAVMVEESTVAALGVLDSLASGATPGAVEKALPGGRALRAAIDAAGLVTVVVTDLSGDTLTHLVTRVDQG